MNRVRTRQIIVPLVLHAALVTNVYAAAEILSPDETRPAVLDSIELPEALELLAVSPGGDRVALTHQVAPSRKGPSTRLELFLESAEPRTWLLPGLVRDLTFSADGSRIYALQNRPAKRNEGDTFLIVVDPADTRTRRVMELAPSARGLSHWPAEHALLIATRDHLRTVLLPAFRSGPVFRLPGENLAVAVVGSGLVLVGQATGLLLVDLYDPPERYQMPVRERLTTPSPITSIALSATGEHGLLRLADGHVLEIRLDPLRVKDAGTGPLLMKTPTTRSVSSIASVRTEPAPASPPPTSRQPLESSPRPKSETVRTPPVAPSSPSPVPPVRANAMPADPHSRTPMTLDPEVAAVEEDPPQMVVGADSVGPVSLEASASVAKPDPEPPEVPADVTKVEPAAPEPTPDLDDLHQPAPPAETIDTAVPEPEDDVPAHSDEPSPGIAVLAGDAQATDPVDIPRPRAGDRQDSHPQVQGKITGDSLPDVIAVVFHGPNNLLREAGRTRPASDGTWEMNGLAPGRYRVQLDGGGAHVLIAEPRFLILEIEEDRSVIAPDIHILRSH